MNMLLDMQEKADIRAFYAKVAKKLSLQEASQLLRHKSIGDLHADFSTHINMTANPFETRARFMYLRRDSNRGLLHVPADSSVLKSLCGQHHNGGFQCRFLSHHKFRLWNFV